MKHLIIPQDELAQDPSALAKLVERCVTFGAASFPKSTVKSVDGPFIKEGGDALFIIYESHGGGAHD